MRYTLRQLEVFLAVARAESVSRAAAALAMSQSAASSALADLERQFDLQLFDRVGKRLRLSALGESVRARAEGVLEQASELEGALANRGHIGRVRVGATLTIGNYVAAPLMARFMAQHPTAELTLSIGNTAEIARQVANFEIDVGLVEGEVEERGLAVTAWREDRLTVFCAPDHPFARRRALDDDDLRAARWILREHGSGTRQAFDRAMHGLLPELRIVLTLQQTEAIRAAVEAGLGLGCLSELAVADAFARGSLRRCRVPGRDFRRQFFFLLHEQKPASAGVQSWIALCRRGG